MHTRTALLAAAIAVGASAVSAGYQPARAQTQAAGTINIGLPFQLSPRYFDPLETANGTYFALLYAVHDALVKLDDGGMRPSIAQTVVANADLTEITYKLRPGITFHNGDALTSADVKFSLENYTGTSAGEFKARIGAIETPDPLTVVVKFKEPWPDYATLAGTTASGFGWIVPKAYYEKLGAKEFMNAPVGLGPFIVEKIEPGRQVTLKRFDAYHGRKPLVERIVMRSGSDAAQALAQVNTGELDVAYNMLGELGVAASKMKGVTLHKNPTYTTFFLKFFDAADPQSPWSKKEVREAVNLAIDRQALSQIETDGASPPTRSIVPEQLSFATKVDIPKADPAKARQLLAQAGYPAGFDGGKLVPIAPYWRMAEAVTAMLRSVGIKVEIQKMERAVFYQKLADKELKGVCLCADGTTGNASTRLGRHIYSKGVHNYMPVPDFDRLYEAQLKETDTAKRSALLAELQGKIVDTAYDAPIFNLALPAAVGPRVKNAAFLIPGNAYIGPYELLELK